MKKLGLVTLGVATLALTTASFADMDITGKYEGGMKLSDTISAGTAKGFTDYATAKAELYLNSDKAFVELNANSGGNNLNQFYIKTKCPLTGADLSLGQIQTGVGKLAKGSILYPASVFNAELEGCGVRAKSAIAGVPVEFGNLGTLLASDTNSAADRILYGQAALNLVGFPTKVALTYRTDSSASKSDIGTIVDIAAKDLVPNLVVNGQLQYQLTNEGAYSQVQGIGASLIYTIMDGVALNGSYTMGLNDATKLLVESDMIAGISKTLANDVKVGIEMQVTKVNAAETVNKISLMYESKI